MAELGTARPVSGEMMAGFEVASPRAPRGDVIDADYIEVQSEARPSKTSRPAVVRASDPSGMSILNKRDGHPPKRRFQPAGPAFWLAGSIVVLTAFWISGGHALFPSPHLPGLRDLESRFRIANVQSRTEVVDGTVALMVDGDVTNEGQATGDVPRIAIQVTTTNGAVATYRLGTSRNSLAPNAKYSFSSRLDMPKDGVKTVSVAFDP